MGKGASGALMAPRCRTILAQVRKKGRDLRRKSRFCALWWRRCNPNSHTCAKKGSHLHRKNH